MTSQPTHNPPTSKAASHPLSLRPTYTATQLNTFLNALTPPLTLSTFTSLMKTSPLTALTTLQRRTLAFNAWGNLALHYSSHRTLSLHPFALFEKIVTRRLGGYCMENNAFFATVLRGLGFRVYVTGARIGWAFDDPLNADEVRRAGFGGWQHEVLIVTLDVGEGKQKKKKRYLCDIGVGSSGAVEPVEIVEGGGLVRGPPGASVRLVKRGIAQFTVPEPGEDEGTRMWVLEMHVRRSEADRAPRDMWDEGDAQGEIKWTAMYCFSEQEWIEGDFEIINYRTSTDRASWFTWRLVLTKMLLDEEGEEVVGTVTLVGDEFSRKMGVGREKEVLRKCKSEEERVEALERWFGVVLKDDEKSGVKGTVVEIKG